MQPLPKRLKRRAGKASPPPELICPALPRASPVWSRAALPLFTRGSGTRKTECPGLTSTSLAFRRGTGSGDVGRNILGEQSYLPSLESTPSLSFSAQLRHPPNLPSQHLQSPPPGPAASPGSTLELHKASPVPSPLSGYNPHFQSCPCLYLFSSSKWARTRSSSPLSSMLRLPGTCWLPPGSLSVMGLEWRSRYWSSSLFQQVEKHLC